MCFFLFLFFILKDIFPNLIIVIRLYSGNSSFFKRERKTSNPLNGAFNKPNQAIEANLFIAKKAINDHLGINDIHAKDLSLSDFANK